MKLKSFKKKSSINIQSAAQGFSLIETAIALTTLAICLAYAMPLFLFAKINNSKSEIRTGALIASQRVFDDIRSKSFADLPLTDGKDRDPDSGSNNWMTDPGTSWKNTGNTDGKNPKVIPENMSTITTEEKSLTYAMGRQYRTKVIYCEPDASAPTVAVCNNNYRKFKVEVSYNGNKVYDLEGTYTEFN